TCPAKDCQKIFSNSEYHSFTVFSSLSFFNIIYPNNKNNFKSLIKNRLFSIYPLMLYLQRPLMPSNSILHVHLIQSQIHSISNFLYHCLFIIVFSFFFTNKY